jgi:hypothetical protein
LQSGLRQFEVGNSGLARCVLLLNMTVSRAFLEPLRDVVREAASELFLRVTDFLDHVVAVGNY